MEWKGERRRRGKEEEKRGEREEGDLCISDGGLAGDDGLAGKVIIIIIVWMS